jgi:NADH-quinone oxidoreductase subunit H
VWFFLKVNFFFFIFMWLRASLPRLRYDQFIKFGWKVLIPLSLVWILTVASLRVIQQEGASRTVIIAFTLGLILIALTITSLLERSKKKSSQQEVEEIPAPDFPVPSLPGISSLNVSAKTGGDRE